MLKKSITYTDLLGNKTTEVFYFQLRESDVVELEMSERYGLTSTIEAASKKSSGKEVVDAVKNIILTAYGEPSPDGKRFIKTPEAREEFYQSPAYDVLFMELVRDANVLAEFIRSVFPKSTATPIVESATNASA